MTSAGNYWSITLRASRRSDACVVGVSACIAHVEGISASSSVAVDVAEAETALDAAEQIASGVARIHADVAGQLLTRLLDQEPAFFEQAVLHLSTAMGYGGAEGVATRTQVSNDQGVDGIIDQDALGLSRIYV